MSLRLAACLPHDNGHSSPQLVTLMHMLSKQQRRYRCNAWGAQSSKCISSRCELPQIQTCVTLHWPPIHHVVLQLDFPLLAATPPHMLWKQKQGCRCDTRNALSSKGHLKQLQAPSYPVWCHAAMAACLPSCAGCATPSACCPASAHAGEATAVLQA